jgi:thioredoxin-like negative regulator of GroEL
VLHRLARAEARVGKHEEALAIARRALAASDAQPEGFLEVAREQAALGHPADAEATLREGLARSPGQAGLSMELATELAKTQRATEAHALLTKVASADPGVRIQVLETDASIWSAQGLTGKALADLRETVQLDPRNPQRRFAVARALEGQGRLHEALTLVIEGLGLLPLDQRATIEAWRDRLRASLDAQARDALLKESDAAPK